MISEEVESSDVVRPSFIKTIIRKKKEEEVAPESIFTF